MTSGFAPIEIPPGVVAKPTKKMRSGNYSEVNMIRWVEGRLAPVGGQSPLNYTFASRCRAIHSWFDLNGVYHIAYVCEAHVYIETGGVLTDVTPSDLGGPVAVGGGYGDYNYSFDTYGTPRSIITPPAKISANIPPMWSVDNFGALLLVMLSTDRRLLQWDPAVGGKLTQVANSPLGRCFVVTPERFVMIFGMQDLSGGGPRRFGWCNQEDPTNWAFTDPASKAGYYDVEPASPIITAVSGKYGVLFWTSKKTYVSQFEGSPFIYSYRELADGATPWSPMSKLATSGLIVWMTPQGPWQFDGTSVVAVPCPVKTWIDGNIDLVNVRYQACAVHVTNFSEFWWFFPEGGTGATGFNTRAAVYNYREGWWSQARMPRSAGITSSYLSDAIMADGLQPFLHEVSTSYYDADLPWADTFPLNVQSGARLTTFKQMIPDLEGNADNLQFLLHLKMNRAGQSRGQAWWTDPKTIDPSGYVNFHQTARDIRLRIQVTGPLVTPFTLGQHLIDVAPRGFR